MKRIFTTFLAFLTAGIITTAVAPNAMAATNNCRNVYYSNGDIRVGICDDYFLNNPTTGKWRSIQRRIYNPPASAGGRAHDVVDYACDWGNPFQGPYECTDSLGETETGVLSDDIVLNTSNTHWVQVESYGWTWCNKVYFAPNKTSSVTGC